VKHDPDAVKDRMAYRQKPSQGDFFLEGLDVEDFLVTMYQPDDFRPVSSPGPLSATLQKFD
jgi:distribution and morphology protein 31